jgi:hypothetical protein
LPVEPVSKLNGAFNTSAIAKNDTLASKVGEEPGKLKESTKEASVELDQSNDKDGASKEVKKVVPKIKYRTNRQSIGSINITRKDNSPVEDSAAFAPNENMYCYWELPCSYFEDNTSVDLQIALFRYGSLANSMSIATKSINNPKSGRTKTDHKGVVYYCGKIQFFAPKAAGRLLYRIFDNANEGANSHVTLAFSTSFVCVLAASDVMSNLKFSLDNFKDKKISPLRTIQQFASSMLHLPLDYAKSPIPSNVQEIIAQCFAKVFEFIEKFRDLMDERNKEQESKDTDKDKDNASANNTEEVVKAKAKEIREGSQFHSESAKFFKQLFSESSRLNYKTLLSPALVREIQLNLERYCPVQHR